MSQQITIEDIYKLFEKTNENFEQLRLEYVSRLTKLEELLICDTQRTVYDSSDSWGRFMEELGKLETVINLFRFRGIDVQEICGSSFVTRKSITMEISMLAASNTEVVVVDCYPCLCKEEVDDFLEKLTRFKEAFPHYQNYQAYGAVAGIEIDEGVDKYAYQQGLFVIKPSGDTVAIINDETFQAKFW